MIIEIRKAKSQDTEAIWSFFQPVIQTGETYVYLPDTPKEALAKLWLAPTMHTYVAQEDDQISGTYIIKANYPGLGSHVANASYMVDPAAHGRGIGTAMGLHSLDEARRLGFRAMQFNLVVSSNSAAVHLWQKLGFAIVGTIPGAFNHRKLGFVDAHVMYRSLEAPV